MSYRLSAVTLPSDNSPAGLAAIGQLWADVTSGKLPLLFDSQGAFQPGLSPLSQYHNYASDETGAHDLTIRAVTADFFAGLEAQVAQGTYRKFETSGDDLTACAHETWSRVWGDKTLPRAFTVDYESTVPAQFSKDGKCHCYLYIAVK